MEDQRKGVERWIVNISEWNPSPDAFLFAMSFLPHHDHTSITRFVNMEDRERALVSRLLQYALVHQVFGVPPGEIVINRTLQGKPFLEYDEGRLMLPNFNFNVSHHGDYVAIASEPLCLVGLDIVSYSIPLKQGVDEFIQSFRAYFSDLEWCSIMNISSLHERLKEFYRYWCVKEAFVKAIGIGVGDRLDHVQFHHSMWKDVSVKVNGQELKDWRFWLLELDENHAVAVARGHPSMAMTNYRATMKRIQFNEEEYQKCLHLPNASFTLQTVDDLLLCLSSSSTDPVS